ncbi:hypothetical protein B2G74_13910 [Burkholderia sp. A27]|nr:hypothetical protein B2G74_13910 [Burkholderia sp. A27]
MGRGACSLELLPGSLFARDDIRQQGALLFEHPRQPRKAGEIVCFLQKGGSFALVGDHGGKIRRVITGQCFIAFTFNVVLALQDVVPPDA